MSETNFGAFLGFASVIAFCALWLAIPALHRWLRRVNHRADVLTGRFAPGEREPSNVVRIGGKQV